MGQGACATFSIVGVIMDRHSDVHIFYLCYITMVSVQFAVSVHIH